MKYFFLIIFTISLMACQEEPYKLKEFIEVPDSINYELTKPKKQGISEFKINDDVKIEFNTDEYLKIEGKELISPQKLFDFLPNKYIEKELIKSSSGKSNSSLGVFTTCIGVYQNKNSSIKVRFSDYYGKKYFPELRFLEKLPKSNETYSFNKLDLNSDFIGFVQTHNTENYTIVEIFAYDRFNINLEYDNISNSKEDYKILLKTINLNKLKEISKKK